MPFGLSKVWNRYGWDFDEMYDVDSPEMFFVLVNRFLGECADGLLSLYGPEVMDRITSSDRLLTPRHVKDVVDNEIMYKLVSPVLLYGYLKANGVNPFDDSQISKELGVNLPEPGRVGVDEDNVSMLCDYDGIVSVKRMVIEKDTLDIDVFGMLVSISYSLNNMYDKMIGRLGLEVHPVKLDKKRLVEVLTPLSPVQRYISLRENKLYPIIPADKFNSSLGHEYKYLKIKMKRKRRK